MKEIKKIHPTYDNTDIDKISPTRVNLAYDAIQYAKAKVQKNLTVGGRMTNKKVKTAYMATLSNAIHISETDEEVTDAMRKSCNLFMKTHNFNPAKMSSLLESENGLKMGSFDNLRSLDTSGGGNNHNHFIHERTTYQNYNKAFSAAVEATLCKTNPTVITKTQTSVVIDLKALLSLIIVQSNLPEEYSVDEDQFANGTKPLKSFEIAYTTDGAKLTATSGFVVAGLKFTDEEVGKRVYMKRKVYSPVTNPLETMNNYFQSPDTIIPVVWTLEPDCIDTNFKINGANMEFAQSLNDGSLLPVILTDTSTRYFSIKVLFPMDKKALNCCFVSGGPTGSSETFCCLCSQRPERRDLCSFIQCETCFHLQRVCHCFPMLTYYERFLKTFHYNVIH